MSNNTYIIITGSLLDKDINRIGFGVDFQLQDIDSITVGNKLSSYAVWSFANNCIGREKLHHIITKFMNSELESYASLVMTVYDDDCDDLEGIYIHPSSRDEIRTSIP